MVSHQLAGMLPCLMIVASITPKSVMTFDFCNSYNIMVTSYRQHRVNMIINVVDRVNTRYLRCYRP